MIPSVDLMLDIATSKLSTIVNNYLTYHSTQKDVQSQRTIYIENGLYFFPTNQRMFILLLCWFIPILTK